MGMGMGKRLVPRILPPCDGRCEMDTGHGTWLYAYIHTRSFLNSNSDSLAHKIRNLKRANGTATATIKNSSIFPYLKVAKKGRKREASGTQSGEKRYTNKSV